MKVGLMKVVIGAGGSGGHLFPAQQLAQKLKEDEVVFAGHGLVKNPFFEKGAHPFVEIAAAPLTEPLSFVKQTWKGFWQAVRFFRRFQPDVVVGFGSYHSFPLLLAAIVLRKKIALFEANCTPGKVNRLLRPFAHVFAVQFPQKKGKLVPFLSGSGKQPAISQAAAREHYGLKPDVLTILIFGGSQGASFLNEQFPQAASRLGVPHQILHFTGKGNVSYPVCSVIKPFEPNMAMAYAAADLVVCRSGAGAVAELIQYEKPALLIPYPYAGGHQIENGKFLARYGAEILLQREATPEKIAEKVRGLVQNGAEIQTRLKKLNAEYRGEDLANLVKRFGS